MMLRFIEKKIKSNEWCCVSLKKKTRHRGANSDDSTTMIGGVLTLPEKKMRVKSNERSCSFSKKKWCWILVLWHVFWHAQKNKKKDWHRRAKSALDECAWTRVFLWGKKRHSDIERTHSITEENTFYHWSDPIVMERNLDVSFHVR